ncbi:hypothetical protein ACFX19_045635 [Malus domestica]
MYDRGIATILFHISWILVENTLIYSSKVKRLSSIILDGRYLQLSDVRIQLIFVRNTGSWMEIGNSISHFGIMSAQVVFVLLLFALTNIYTKDIDIGSVDRSSRKAM